MIFIGKGKTDKVKTDKEIDDNPSLLTVACSYRSREGEFHSRLRKSLDHWICAVEVISELDERKLVSDK